MQKVYIRFGEIPKNEKSKIYCGDDFIGFEKGVSVYEGLLNDGRYSIIMPSLSYSACVSLSGCIEREPYLVTGEKVGTGSDGEPLLKNVKILKRGIFKR